MPTNELEAWTAGAVSLYSRGCGTPDLSGLWTVLAVLFIAIAVGTLAGFFSSRREPADGYGAFGFYVSGILFAVCWPVTLPVQIARRGAPEVAAPVRKR